jgi:hypothetical protein
MPEGDDSYTFDVRGLLAWSESSSNEFSFTHADVASGKVRIFSPAYNEFCAAYDEEAAVLKKLEIKREHLTEEHRQSVIAVTENAKATFGWKGPYDKAVEWQIAGIACCESLTVVTDERGKRLYSKIDGIQAITFDEFVDRHDE